MEKALEALLISMGQELFKTAQEPRFFLPIKKAGHNDTYLFGGKRYFEALAEFVTKGRIRGFSD